MTSKQNPFFKVTQELGKEMVDLRNRARKSKAVPFGLEQVTAAQARNRLQTMTRADLEKMPIPQYQELVKSVGTQAIIEVVLRDQAPPASANDPFGAPGTMQPQNTPDPFGL